VIPLPFSSLVKIGRYLVPMVYSGARMNKKDFPGELLKVIPLNHKKR